MPCMNTLGPFAMYAAFPRSDYYEPSAPPHGHRPTTRLPESLRLEGVTHGSRAVVPTFTVHRSTGEVPGFAPAISP